MASRAILYSRSARIPWSTSCRTGRQVAISSNGTAASRSNGRSSRKISIQTDVSTRTTARPRARGCLDPESISSHGGEVPVPRSGTRDGQDLPRADPADEVLQRSADRGGIRALSAQAEGVVQELLI